MGLFTRTIDFFKSKKTFYGNEMIFDFLKDGSSAEMNVNGSVTPVEFIYTVPVGKSAWIERINFAGHNSGITADGFMGLPLLANGIDIECFDDQDNLLINFFDGLSVKENVDLAALAGTDVSIDARGSGQDSMLVRWTISRCGQPLFMRAGYKFKITINDDLSTIVHLRAMIQGIIVDSF